MSQPQQTPTPENPYQDAGYPPPNPQGYPPAGGPAGYPPQQYGAQPPNYYAAAPPPMPAHHQRPPLVSIISPDDAKKIRKMQIINFAATMLQLCCSLAIILIVRNSLYKVSLQRVPGSDQVLMSTSCLAATSAFPGTCEYAYSLASVSIFFGFILSLMQCLTMDCCGAGRAIEAGFDAAACAWWIAGGITLGVRASEANAAGLAEWSARNAVVALCWISAGFFLILLCTNIVLIKRLGKAYKAAAQQMQQHLTAMPATGYPQGGAGLQMGGMMGPPAGYPQPQQQPGYPPQQQWGAHPPAGGVGGTVPPAGYPTTFTPPAPGTAGAAPATGTHAV